MYSFLLAGTPTLQGAPSSAAAAAHRYGDASPARVDGPDHGRASLRRRSCCIHITVSGTVYAYYKRPLCMYVAIKGHTNLRGESLSQVFWVKFTLSLVL